jgi:DNA-binding transcriptional MocR family regulator
METTNPMEHPDRVTEDTQQAIAEDLGVSRKTVGRATDELPEDVKRGQLTELNTDEKTLPTPPGPGETTNPMETPA